MDITTLTALAMGLLTAMVSNVGEDVYAETKELTTHLYERIRSRFIHEQDGGRASQALQTFVDGDADFGSVVEKKLVTILQADPVFSAELAQLLQSAPRQLLMAAEEARASHIRISNTLGKGEQEIHLGTRASADDIQLHIGQEETSL
jgi:hypothetical protein